MKDIGVKNCIGDVSVGEYFDIEVFDIVYQISSGL